MTKVLSIHASANADYSVTNGLISEFLAGYGEKASVTKRDVSAGLPIIDAEWTGANFTAEADRSDAQKEKLSLSDSLIGELEDNDLILISIPVYNFSIPASLKSWIDLICRAGKTFNYTENGPVGLLENKKVVLFVASGGTEVDSGYDFATPYMKHVLGFIGLTDVEVVAADTVALNAEAVAEKKAAAKEFGAKLAA